jgi:hypothetical protein
MLEDMHIALDFVTIDPIPLRRLARSLTRMVSNRFRRLSVTLELWLGEKVIATSTLFLAIAEVLHGPEFRQLKDLRIHFHTRNEEADYLQAIAIDRLQCLQKLKGVSILTEAFSTEGGVPYTLADGPENDEESDDDSGAQATPYTDSEDE